MSLRPKAGESEEDILKLQEEFLSKKSTPSASIVNKRKSEEGNDPGSGMYACVMWHQKFKIRITLQPVVMHI
jgi:hypothetical protein